jgi:hypothetical protein
MTRLRNVIAIVLPALLLISGIVPAAARQEALPPIEVGAGPIGEPSLRFVGRVVYAPERMQLVGYLTGGTNLAPLLSTGDGPPDLATARFTFSAEIADLEQTNRADLRTIGGVGELRIYLDTGGADWDDPATFADGELVATYTVRLAEALQRQAPTIGVVVGDAEMTQDEAGEFSLDGTAYRFGDAGIASRLRYTGALIGDEADQRPALASVVGTVIVTDRAARAVPLGANAAPGS